MTIPATIISIVNAGLNKIGESRINNITPPKSVTERTVNEQFGQWRDSELSKRRWIFATEIVILTQEGTQPLDGTYAFGKPAGLLRIVRDKKSVWQRRGNRIYSRNATETVEAIFSVDESLFDPLFIDVLAARCAIELVEPITQSNEKWQKAQKLYDDAVKIAGRLNAFQLEPDDLETPDDDSEWLNARVYGPFG